MPRPASDLALLPPRPSPHAALRAMDSFGDDLARFAALDIPTLLVIGELSPGWLTDVSRRLHQALPDARLVEIPGEAHDAFLTGPHALADAIASFAGGLPCLLEPLREQD